ncbi:MAG: prepilin-type N-terminal cleavage/methylation domain-containing protein, partial [Deltaproteobacteria bacterium]|nr:prepilin-type N-terminal cleavage/methylation domain-containing protein [Deltaproteobacteria bacterium]
PAGPPAAVRGTTLLELMIAIAVIATAMAAVLGSQSQSVSFSGDAKFSTTAALLAQHRAAEIETLNPLDLRSRDGDFGEAFPGYAWRLEVTDPVLLGMKGVSDHLRRVDLTITWGRGDRYAYAVRLVPFSPRRP